jgi:hypothetical protein
LAFFTTHRPDGHQLGAHGGPATFDFRASASFRDTFRFGRSESITDLTTNNLSGLLSWGSFKTAPPLTQVSCVHSRPIRRPPFDLKCHSQVCSALVVPPDFDGLLRSIPCRFIAPCCQPWGSPCSELRGTRKCSVTLRLAPTLGALSSQQPGWRCRFPVPSRRLVLAFGVPRCWLATLMGPSTSSSASGP